MNKFYEKHEEGRTSKGGKDLWSTNEKITYVPGSLMQILADDKGKEPMHGMWS